MTAFEENRRHWDALGRVHGEGDRVYDVEALVAGGDSLHDVEDRALRLAVGDVRGLDVLHLQCHLAFDAISLARRGARVTAADFSPAALAKASAIGQRCGVELELVEADATALPPQLHGRFDVVYATIGVLSWIGDLGAWMRSAAGALRPGGRLVLVEIHPLLDMLAGVAPLRADFPYAFDGPRRFDEPGSYADPEAPVKHTTQVVFAHALGETVTAALDAGLVLERLDEHLDAAFDPRGDVLGPPDPDKRHRLRLDSELLPILFTLIARQP